MSKNDYSEIMFTLGELKESVKRIDEALTGDAGLTRRVSAVERWQDNATGKIAVISVLVGALITLVGAWLRKILGI